MSWNTKITKLLNIDYPIIQGAMAYISDGVLAAAMSHAGCAGVIGSGGFTPDEVQSHIRRFKDIAGSQKVYGVNLMLQDDNKDDIAQIICDEKVPFVTIGAGNPIPWFEPFHQKGIKCIPVVPNVKLAQRVQAHGADALVVEGMDSVVTGFTTGDSVRGLKNRFSDRYLKAEYSGASPDELSSISAGTTKRGALLGDTENGFILAGMSLTHLTKIQSAKEIVEELVSETERRLAAAPGLI